MQGIARPIVEPIARAIDGSMDDSNSSGPSTPYLGVGFTQQPVDWFGLEGGTATFSVLTSSGNASPVSYQWYELIGGSWQVMGGETTSTLTIAGVLIADNGRTFRCDGTNTFNTKSSAQASIVITGATWFITDELGNRTVTEILLNEIVDERSP